MTAPSPQQVLRAARECFLGSPGYRRWIQQNRPRVCPFDRLIGYIPDGASVLDVGCGDGLFLGLLTVLGTQINGMGFDLSQHAIASAQAMAHRIGADGQLRFSHIDALSDWPEGEFDVVSMIDVLHHVPPQAQRSVIERAASRIRPGGLFVYKDIVGGLAGLMNRIHDLVVAREIIHYVPGATVEAWAAGAGLHLADAAEIRMLWYPHLLKVFRRQ